MLDPDKIQFYLNLFKNISLGDLLVLFKAAKTRHLAAGDIYIHEGALTSKMAYVKKGLIRSYQVDEKGDERTLILRWEDTVVASHDNIFFKKPSRFVYEALEDTILLEADFDTIQSILEKNPKFEQTRHYFMLNSLAQSMARVESFILLSPEERYLQFINERPGLAQRVPDKHLATLLGITPVSLSRIRKRIASRQKR